MTALEHIKENYKAGQKIFEELFELSDAELCDKLIEITEDNHNDVLTGDYSCYRTIKDGKPNKIEFWFYDCVIVDWRGVTLKPEHGPETQLIKFNKFFKLV